MRDRDGRSSGRNRERPPLDRVRDAAQVRNRAELSRRRERDRPGWGHAFREHVDVTEQQLARRAATGINARGHRDDFTPEHATRWQSGAACVIAADRIWHTPEARRQRDEIEARIRAGQRTKQGFDGRVPLSQALGPGWRDDVYGLSRESQGRKPSEWRTDSQAVAVFRRQVDGRWHLYTCYPEVEPPTWA